MIKSHSKALFMDVRNMVVPAVLLVALFFAFGMQSTSSANTAVEITKSSEIGFTSVSPRGISGGEIIPASCESGLGEGGIAHFGGDTSGYCDGLCHDPAASNYLGVGACTYPPVNGACAATRYTCQQQTCSENNNCPGTVLSCNYWAPDAPGGNLANSPSKPVSFGPWSNIQCGTSGTGWHQGGISSCSTGQGSTNAKCTSVVLQPSGINANETSSAWTWSCAGLNGGSTASCSEAKNACYPSADPANYGTVCSLTSSPNACSQTTSANTGTIGCDGTTCTGTPPPPPAVTIPGGNTYGAYCTSAPNVCSQTQSNGTWQCNGSCSSTPPPDSNCTYTVTASAGAGGTISQASRSVNYGSNTTFTVTPNAGYTASATGCGGSLSGTTYTTGAITGACTVSATFAVNPYPVAASAGAGGTISPASRSVNYGSNTTFTVTPNAGYTASATGCGGSLPGTTYTTGAITGACAGSATFSVNTYTVTASAGAGGTISPPSRSVNYGSNTTFTVTPNAGYTASATGCGGSLSGTTYTTGAITGACTVSATFTAPDLTITDSISPQTATQDSPTVFSTTIRNIGSRSTGASFNNFMQVATNPNGGGTITDISPAISMPALAVSGTGAFSKSYTFASNGSYSLRVCADKTDRNSAGVIPESDDNNNCGGWENIVVSSASCANGANNYPACNTCTLPLVWNGTSCVVCNGGCGPGPSCNNGATNPASCSIFTPTATLSVDDNEIDVGQATILRWNSTNATSCTGTGFSTGGATSGSASTGALSPAGTYNYQVVCSGTGVDSPP